MRGFCAFLAFDLSFAVVPLNIVIGLGIIDFWHCSVSKQASACQGSAQCMSSTQTVSMIETPKNPCFPILWQLLMVPLPKSGQKLPKITETST